MNDIIFVINNDSGTPQQQSVTTARDKEKKKKKKEKEVQSSTFSPLVMIAKREMILLPVAPFRH